MANRDAPSGFRPARHANGGTPHRVNRYFIASALASNIFRGDPVIPVNTNKRINVAAAGNMLIGVFNQVAYVNAQGEPKFEKFWPTGQTLQTGSVAEALVYDDPDMLFEIQASGAVAQTDIGNHADITMATAGSTLTGVSGCEVDSGTYGTAAAQVRIEQFVDRPDNEVGTNAKVLVRISEHYLRGVLTGI